MASIVQSFREGGPGMLGVLFGDCACGGVWIPVLVLAMVLRRGSGRRMIQFFAGGCLLAALIPAAVGTLAWWTNHRKVEQAVAFADPEQRELLREVGNAEARLPLEFGGPSSVALALAYLLPLALSFRAEKSEAE